MKAVALDEIDAIDDADLSFHRRFEAIRPRLAARCQTVVGRDDAEDVVQETYLRARERIGQLRKPSAFEAWVTRIALNEARSVARRRATYQEQLGDGDRPRDHSPSPSSIRSPQTFPPPKSVSQTPGIARVPIATRNPTRRRIPTIAHTSRLRPDW